jgi:hypothetical protein
MRYSTSLKYSFTVGLKYNSFFGASLQVSVAQPAKRNGSIVPTETSGKTGQVVSTNFRWIKTSFSPNFNNKTTSVAEEYPTEQPHYLINK